MKDRLECRCGGALRKDGNQYVCENCDSIYLISADEKGELFAYQPIEKKHIQTGQMAQKSATIPVKQVVVRQIRLDDDIAGQVAQESMDLDKPSRIGLIEGYLATADWEKVDEHVNGLLLEDKDCAEAKWYSWMCERRAADDQQMLAKLNDFSQADSKRLDRILEYASPTFAKRIVELFFHGAFSNDSMCFYALSAILPYARNEVIYAEEVFSKKVKTAFARVIDKRYEKAFNYLLENALQPEAVDDFIHYVIRFADRCDARTSLEYYERVLAVDPGNMKVHRKMVRADIKCDAACKKTISDVERLVSYSDDTDQDIAAFLSQLCDEPKTTVNKSEIMWNLLSYHSAAPEGLKAELLAYGHVLLESRLWNRARDFFNLVLSFDVRCGDAYWGLCLVQMEARNEQDAISKKEPIKSFSAYDKALSVYSAAGKTQQAAHLRALSEEQKEKKKQLRNMLIIGAAILAAILLIIISSKISQAMKYSANNMKLTLVNTDSVKTPVTEFKLEIRNGCTEYLRSIDMTFYFYDSQDNLIVSTGLNTSCNLSHRKSATWTISLHEAVAEALAPYRFEELKITVAIESLYFSDPYHREDLGEGKERVLKEAEKMDVIRRQTLPVTLEHVDREYQKEVEYG